jgi:hypothetical protein
MKLYSKKAEVGNSKKIIWGFSLLRVFVSVLVNQEHATILLCRLTETRKLNRRQLLSPSTLNISAHTAQG